MRDPLDAADQCPQRERDASRRSVADHGRGMLAGIAPASASMVDELLAERRSEVAREDRE